MKIKGVEKLFLTISASFCFALASCDTATQPSSSSQASSYSSSQQPSTSIPEPTSSGSSSSRPSGIYHTVMFNTNGGSSLSSERILHGEKITKPDDPIKAGYHLVNWTYKNEPWSFAGYVVTEDMILNAVWELSTYSITYVLNEGYDSTNNPHSYTSIDSFSLENPSRTGYTFLGWFDENDNKVESIKKGTTGDLVLTGLWNEGNQYSVNLDPKGGSIPSSTLVVQYNHSYTLPTPTRDGYTFLGWYEGTTKVANSGIWGYLKNKSYFAKWVKSDGVIPTISSDGKTLTYGLYPQTNVNDPTLISSLNALTNKESNGWYLYNDEYYINLNATPNTLDLYFCPVFDNGTRIIEGRSYWFKCEPIVWNVLSSNNNKYYLLSSVLLDAQRYFSSTDTRNINDQTIYPNNYKYSDIRTWLNADFYNSAFGLNNKNIQITMVNNSASTTSSSTNSYICDNTEDKVFLLSYQDYLNESYGFSNSTNATNTRYCKTTDWARARGIYYYKESETYFNGYYFTRSPGPHDKEYAACITYEGKLGNDIGGSVINTHGVRPAINISLN